MSKIRFIQFYVIVKLENDIILKATRRKKKLFTKENKNKNLPNQPRTLTTPAGSFV